MIAWNNARKEYAYDGRKREKRDGLKRKGFSDIKGLYKRRDYISSGLGGRTEGQEEKGNTGG
jgi:hypothetical protein